MSLPMQTAESACLRRWASFLKGNVDAKPSRHQKDLAGVGATDLFAWGDSDHIDLLAFVKGAVNEAFFARDRQTKRNLSRLGIDGFRIRFFDGRFRRWGSFGNGISLRRLAIRWDGWPRRVDVLRGLIKGATTHLTRDGQWWRQGILQVAGFLPPAPRTRV